MRSAMDTEPPKQTPEEMMAILKAYGQAVKNQPAIEAELRALFPNDVEPLMRAPELVMVHCQLNVVALEQLSVPERHAMILSAIRLEQKTRAQVVQDTQASIDDGQEIPELAMLCAQRQSVTIDSLPDWVFKVVDVLWKHGLNRGDTILDCCLDALNLDRKVFSEENVRWALQKLVDDRRLERRKYTPKKWGPGCVMRIGTRPPETSLQNFDYIPVSNANILTMPSQSASSERAEAGAMAKNKLKNITEGGKLDRLQKFLEYSQKALPVVKYAIGAGGFVTVGLILIRLGAEASSIPIIFLMLLFGAVCLIVLQRIAKAQNQLQAILLAWVASICASVLFVGFTVGVLFYPESVKHRFEMIFGANGTSPYVGKKDANDGLKRAKGQAVTEPVEAKSTPPELISKKFKMSIKTYGVETPGMQIPEVTGDIPIQIPDESKIVKEVRYDVTGNEPDLCKFDIKGIHASTNAGVVILTAGGNPQRPNDPKRNIKAGGIVEITITYWVEK